MPYCSPAIWYARGVLCLFVFSFQIWCPCGILVVLSFMVLLLFMLLFFYLVFAFAFAPTHPDTLTPTDPSSSLPSSCLVVSE